MGAELLTLGIGIFLVYPVWRIFDRVGLPPALSLVVFLGFPGIWLAATMLAFGPWPAIEGDRKGGSRS